MGLGQLCKPFTPLQYTNAAFLMLTIMSSLELHHYDTKMFQLTFFLVEGQCFKYDLQRKITSLREKYWWAFDSQTRSWGTIEKHSNQQIAFCDKSDDYVLFRN